MKDLAKVVANAQAGDIDAFTAMVRRYQNMAVGYAYSVLGDLDLAADAAQEAFVRAYLDLATLREPHAFPAWFRRIVFKQCDRLIRGKRVTTVSLDAAPEAAAPTGDPRRPSETER